MAWETVAKCDVCRVVKGESNHWLLVQVMTWPFPEFRIVYWDEDLSKDNFIKIVCGEQCLQRLLQPFLDARSTIPATNSCPNPNPTDKGSENESANETTDDDTIYSEYDSRNNACNDNGLR
jgi:hypothetical protein